VVSQQFPALNGSVKLENGSKVTNDVYGGSAQVQAAGDAASTSSVTIKDKSSVTGDVYGSFAFTLRGKATATGTVTVINSKVDSVYGAVAESNSTSIATGKVTISDSSVASDVYGGYADTLAGTATADNNQVTISDSTLSGKVYGGYIFSDTGTGTANSNTVTLRGAVNFTGTRELYGGYSEVTGKDVFTGNTLNVDNYTGTATFDKIANFEFFNFTIPTSSKDSDAILQTDHLVLGDGADKPSTVGTVQFSGASVPDLKIEDKIILIDSKETVNSSGEKAIDGVDFKGGDLTVKWGSMFEQLFTSSLVGDDIIIVAETAGIKLPDSEVPSDGGIIGGGGDSPGPVKLKDGSRSLAEASFTGFALVNQGADLVAGQAMENATQGAEGFSPFAAVVAGTSRYSAGSDSHTDVSGYSMAVGLAYSAEVNDIIDRITLGAFFEHGAGNYHTGNDFASGHGDTQYTGGGILGQVSFEDTGPGHFYAQAAIRAGGVTSDFSTSDLQASGINAGYDATKAYRSLYAGIGYVWDVMSNARLDTYAKYFLTQMDGDSVRITTGEPVEFETVTSRRLRLGTRFTYAINEYVSPYIGVGYEREFDGQVNASTYGYDLDAPSLRGDTGLGEIGLTITPTEGKAFSLNLGLQGFTGVREGWQGSLQMKYEF